MMHFYLTLLAILYGVIVFFDTIFKTCMFYPYLTLMSTLGISIKPYSFIWSVTKYNRTLNKMAHNHLTLLKRYFNLGYYITFISIFVGIVLLLIPIVRYFVLSVPLGDSSSVVTVVPGINTPFSHIAYAIPALVISMLFHEYGHALAASREKVNIESCGIALVVIFPVAFVNLAHHKLNLLSHKAQLRVYCAGVWHNFLLCFFAILFVFYAPILLYPVLLQGTGVTVMHIDKFAAMAQHGGLEKGDIITSVNDCEINDLLSWHQCLVNIKSSSQIGFCSSENFIKSYGNITNHCPSSPAHLCFEYSDQRDNSIMDKQFVYLPGRLLIDQSTFCRNTSYCEQKVCLIPYLLTPDERLLKFKRKDKKFVLYAGPIEEVFASIHIRPWVSTGIFPTAEVMIHVEIFLQYLTGISAGIILMNIIPCFLLDGGYIAENIVDIFFKYHWSRAFRKKLVTQLKLIGLLLLTINTLIGLKNLILTTTYNPMDT